MRRPGAYTNTIPARLPVIPKDAVFRLWAYDWVRPNGERWDHKGNPLEPSFLSRYQKVRPI